MPYLHPKRRLQLLLWSGVDVALGCVLVASPAARFSSPAWDTAKAFAPMRTWGLVACVLGAVWLAVVLVSRIIPWPELGYLIGLPAALLAGWHAFFWMALCFATFPQHKIALTGCVVYLGVTIQHLLFAVDPV